MSSLSSVPLKMTFNQSQITHEREKGVVGNILKKNYFEKAIRIRCKLGGETVQALAFFGCWT